jgi:hypothetical protein
MSDIRMEREERSLPALLSQLMRDSTDLVRQEIALAKAEAAEKVSQTTTAIVALAIGGAVAFAGFLVLLDAAVYALAELVGPWTEDWPAMPSLIVGLVVAILGIVLVARGARSLSAGSLAPRRTVEQLRRDGELVKEHLP